MKINVRIDPMYYELKKNNRKGSEIAIIRSTRARVPEYVVEMTYVSA